MLVRRQEETQPIHFHVKDMESDGLAKIRHVGGWAIKKSLDNSRRYVKENKFSRSSNVRRRVNNELKKSELLENNIAVPYQALQKTTNCPETLNVT